MKDETGRTSMHRTLLFGLSAGLLMALNVNAAESTSPASTMVSELSDAAGKCQLVALKEDTQEQSDNTTISNATQSGVAGGHSSAAMNAIAEATLNRKVNDGQFDACLEIAKDAGKAAYQKYQAAPGQPQAIKDDARAVYMAWLAVLPDLRKFSTPNAPNSSELSAYRKALATLRMDDLEK
jgi:hypothetical protein